MSNQAASSPVSSNAAPSQGAGQGQSQGQGGGEPSPSKGGAGADVVQFQEILKNQHSHMERLRGELGETQKRTKNAEGILEKIGSIFKGDEGKKEPDRRAQFEQQLDYYLAEAVEAEKRGTPLPLTTNLAVQMFQNFMRQEQEGQQLAKDLADIKNALKIATDPQATINHTAYGHIDTALMEGLDSLYGADQKYMAQKAGQFQTISRQIAEGIKTLQDKAPQEWDRIRRQPASLQKLVTYYLRQNIPPQAMQILEREKLQSEPMSTEELWQAFREAGEMENAEERGEIRTRIRQEILERMAQGQKQRR